MEILSDATFKGNLNVKGEATFSKNVNFGSTTRFTGKVNFGSTTRFTGKVCGSEFKSTGPITGLYYKIFDSSLKEKSWVEYGQERDCSANAGIIYCSASEFHYTTTTFGAKVELKNACAGDGSVNFIGLTSNDGNHYNQSFQNKCGTIALTSDIPDISSIKSVKYAQMRLTAPSDCTLFAVDLGGTGFSFTNDTDIISARVDRYFLSGDADANPNLGYCYWEPTSTDIILSCPPSATEPGKIVIRKASGVAFDNEKRYILKLAYT